MKTSLNILLLEPDKHAVEDLIKKYTTIFETKNYNPNFTVIDHPRNTITDLKKKTVSKIIECKIDIFICDISLGEEIENLEGLGTIDKIKKQFPFLLVIANTKNTLYTTDTDPYEYTFDYLVNKGSLKLGSRSYLRISRELPELIKFNPFVSLSSNSDLGKSDLVSGASREYELLCILKQVTFQTNFISDKQSISEVRLNIIAGGNSGSVIYQMTSFTQIGSQAITSILKISEIDDSKKERDNYLNYVKWNLPFQWRVEMIGYGAGKFIGGICYSLANKEEDFQTLSKQVKIGDFTKVENVIQSFFNAEDLSWYNKANRKQANNITDFYYNKWFSGSNGSTRLVKHSIFKSLCDEYNIQNNKNKIKINDEWYLRPEGYLMQERYEFWTSICHGDLNLENIFVSKNSVNPILIDFHQTGRGHVFCDFIVFENSIRTHLALDSSFDELFELEQNLHKVVKNNIALKFNLEPFNVISNLRKKALEIFPEAKYTGYVYGLTMSAYSFLKSYPKNQNKGYYKKLFATVLAGLHYLQTHKLERIEIKRTNNKHHELEKDIDSISKEFEAFISFNSKSRNFIKLVVGQLKDKGYKIWFDEYELEAGTELVQSISGGIEKTNLFFVVCGDYDSGKWQEKEIGQIVYNFIEEKNVKIVPCIDPDSEKPYIPPSLKNMKYIKLNGDHIKAAEQLIDEINKSKV